MPNSLSVIKEQTFSYCKSLKSVDIPNSVTEIGKEAFYWCESLTSVLIGKSVKTIGDYAFGRDRKISEIISLNTTPPVAPEYCFSDVNTSTCVLKVPTKAVEDYKAADTWKDFMGIVALTDEEYLALGIESIDAQNSKSKSQNQFNLSGLRVGDGAKGIVIQSGRKSVRR